MEYALPDGTVFGRYTGRAWRESRGLTPGDLVEAFGGRTDRVVDSEDGRKVPSTRGMWTRARSWGCSPSDLWQWADHGVVLPETPGAGGWDTGRYGLLRLRGLREAKGLTQGQVGALLDCSKQMIAQWESGARTPGLDTIWRLSRALDVPTGHLWRWL